MSNPTAIPVEDPAVVTVENSIPRAITVGPDTLVRDYWAARAHQHTTDRYLGIKMSKFPEDLRVYEHLMWVAAPDVIVELGAQSGASTLWLRDRLRTLHGYGALAAPPRVIAVDIDLDAARYNVGVRDPEWADSISFVEGSVCDPAVRAAVQAHVPHGAVCMVIEDSAHVHETTRAALELYSDLIAPGGFFVVEDGCVDVPWMRIKDDWPEGVLPALNEWLVTPQGSAFRVRRDLEVYGVSCHPGGFLQRIA
ncbi:MAG TPA: CmcI family methyltransferase [Conexibacter sp.]|nr:CmcI family methyltransferase [Conexibacter sp.]